MAKRKPRRKFRRYLRGQVNHNLDVGALNASNILSEVIADTIVEKAWLSSVKLLWSLQQWTTSADTGPIVVGIAHSDYTGAEIEEWIENAGSWDQGDLRSLEISRRKIRRVGVFETPSGTNLATTLNDGRQITTKCGWQLISGQTLRVWVYNMGALPVVTGADVEISGHCNLWPN